MLKRFTFTRIFEGTLAAIAALVLLPALPGSAIARPADHTTNPHRPSMSIPPEAATGGGQPAPLTRSRQPATDTAIDVSPPVPVPRKRPFVVPLFKNKRFANATPPYTTTVNLPYGDWSKIVLHVSYTEHGVQYDRLFQVSVGKNLLFVGGTQEPFGNGIKGVETKDVTAYAPVLRGRRTFTMWINNYSFGPYTGQPLASASLYFYRARRFLPAHSSTADLSMPAANRPNPADISMPSNRQTVVPVVADSNTNGLPSAVHPGDTFTAHVNNPNDIVGAQLNLYAINQHNDEFFWNLDPAFREAEVSIDGQPAGVAWLFPYIFTGGVNPYLWRPIMSIQQGNIPAYKLDLTPFAGLLGGRHTITVKIQNNNDYWLIGGSLLLQETRGAQTSGKILADTLTFPTDDHNAHGTALGTDQDIIEDETANKHYTIRGEIKVHGRTWTAGVKGSLQYENHHPVTQSVEFEQQHTAQTVSTTRSLKAPGGRTATAQERQDYTLQFDDAYFGDSNYFYPTGGSLSRDTTTDVRPFRGRPYSSDLHEAIQAYGILGAGSGYTRGSTTGDSTFHDSTGQYYSRVVMATDYDVTYDHIVNKLNGGPTPPGL